MDFALFGFIAANVAAAMSGAFFKPGRWYDQLNKPWWRPPNWLFPIAWSVLYAMIAAAGWIVWQADSLARTWPALTVYGFQLVLNAGWSALFFGMRRMDLAFVELLGLWASILAMIVLFHPISALAAWLLVPYLLWVSFAGVLNFRVWRMNVDAVAG